MVTSLYRYRWLLYELVMRDLVLRYRGSVLGFFWTLLNPLLFTLVYTLVFATFMRIGIPNYTVFLLAALIPWQWFSTALSLGTSAIVDGRMFVGKAVFAPAILVLVPVLSNFFNYLFSLPILIGLVLISGGHLGWPLLALPVLIGIQLLLTTGILLLLSTLNVFFRDLQQLVGVVIMLLFYLAPIVYPIENVPPQLVKYVLANPFAPIALGYQAIFYHDRFPDPAMTLYALAAGAVFFFAGRAVFNRYKDAFADYV